MCQTAKSTLFPEKSMKRCNGSRPISFTAEKNNTPYSYEMRKMVLRTKNIGYN